MHFAKFCQGLDIVNDMIMAAEAAPIEADSSKGAQLSLANGTKVYFDTGSFDTKTFEYFADDIIKSRIVEIIDVQNNVIQLNTISEDKKNTNFIAIIGDQISAVAGELKFNNGAFSGCTSVTKLVFPPTTILANAYSFAQSTSLNYIDAPGLISANSYAFYGCRSLSSINSQISSIGTSTFDGCSSLIQFNKDNSLLGTLPRRSLFGCTSLSTLDISHVDEIGESALVSCTSLTDLDLSSCQIINKYACAYCTGLRTLTFDGNSIPTIGENAFIGCPDLSVTFVGKRLSWIAKQTDYPWGLNPGNIFSERSDEVLFVELNDGMQLSLLNEVSPSEDEIDYSRICLLTDESQYQYQLIDFTNTPRLEYDQVNSLVAGATKPIRALFGDMVTEIAAGALSSIQFYSGQTFPRQISGVYQKAFIGNTTLTGFDTDLEYVGTSAFADCTNLSSIDMTRLTSIPDYGFRSTALAEVNLSAANSVGECCFRDCRRLSAVIAPEVTDIGASAFCGCTGISSIDLQNCANIRSYAFAGTYISALDLPNIDFDDAFRPFAGMTQLEKLSLPNYSTAEIYDVNYVASLKTLDAPIQSVEDGALSGMAALTECTTTQLTSIGDYGFADDACLTNIDLDRVTDYGSGALMNCRDIGPTLSIANNATIGPSAFYGCAGLRTIFIPPTVDDIGIDAFGGRTDLTVNFVDRNKTTVKQLKNYGKWGTFTQITDNQLTSDFQVQGEIRHLDHKLAMPDGNLSASYVICDESDPVIDLTEVADGKLTRSVLTAALDAAGLKISDQFIPEFSEHLTSIDDDVFNGVTAMQKFTLPENIKTLGDSAFSKTAGISSVDSSTLIRFGDRCFEGSPDLTSVNTPIMSAFGSYAFHDCAKLIDVAFGCHSIPTAAFAGCTTLENYSSWNEVSSIGLCAFYGCNSLQNVDLLSTTDIDASAFVDCTTIKSLTIPSSLTSIGKDAFTGCTSLADITFADRNYHQVSTEIANWPWGLDVDGIVINADPIPPKTFQLADDVVLCMLNEIIQVVPEEHSRAYYLSTENNLLDFSDYKTLTEDVVDRKLTSLRHNRMDNLIAILGDKIETIGQNAFNGMTNLSNLDIPANLKKIESRAFLRTPIESVQSDSLTEIGEYAFSECTLLTSINADNVTKIGQRAFNNTKITDITFDLATDIEYTAFRGLPDLTSISLSKTTNTPELDESTSLKSFTADSITSAPSLTYNKLVENMSIASVKYIPENQYIHLTGLTSINISSATEVKDNAFTELTSLRSVDCQSIISAGQQSFMNCSNANFPVLSNLTYAGPSAFMNCYNLMSVDMTSLSTDTSYVGDYAFAGCTGLRQISFTRQHSYDIDKLLGKNVFEGCTNITAALFTLTTKSALQELENYPWGLNPDIIIADEWKNELSVDIRLSVQRNHIEELLSDKRLNASDIDRLVFSENVRGILPDVLSDFTELTAVVFDGIPPQGIDKNQFDTNTKLKKIQFNAGDWHDICHIPGFPWNQPYSKIVDFNNQGWPYGPNYVIIDKPCRKFDLGDGGQAYAEMIVDFTVRETDELFTIPMRASESIFKKGIWKYGTIENSVFIPDDNYNMPQLSVWEEYNDHYTDQCCWYYRYDDSNYIGIAFDRLHNSWWFSTPGPSFDVISDMSYGEYSRVIQVKDPSDNIHTYVWFPN